MSNKIIPIFTTRGDVEAFLFYPHLYNRSGEWIGWVRADRQVYSVHGHYVGWLNGDWRILRRESDAYDRERQTPPARPKSIIPPGSSPLPPMMPDLQAGVIDVLDDAPDLLPSVDYGDLREDLD